MHAYVVLLLSCIAYMHVEVNKEAGNRNKTTTKVKIRFMNPFIFSSLVINHPYVWCTSEGVFADPS